jgi:hypothetical protein
MHDYCGVVRKREQGIGNRKHKKTEAGRMDQRTQEKAADFEKRKVCATWQQQIGRMAKL